MSGPLHKANEPAVPDGPRLPLDGAKVTAIRPAMDAGRRHDSGSAGTDPDLWSMLEAVITDAQSPQRVVAGVDGCRAGWVMAELAAGAITVGFEATFAAVMDRCGEIDSEVIAVDIPIGFAADGVRPAESEARRRLGARRSSLFPTPAHAVLKAADWNQALTINRAVTGKGLSKQSFNLLAKSREVRAAVEPGDRRIVEAHPESSFTAMAGRPLEPKKSPTGRRQRRSLIAHHVGRVDTTAVDGRIGVGLDDILDACAVGWTAWRVAQGRAETLGSGHDPDGFSLALII
jgi:predicted RNase H-like nuclease